MKRGIDTSIFKGLTKALQSKLGDGLVSIVLFGSRARGEGAGTSDWDIFLLAEDLPEHPFDRQCFLREMIPKEFPIQISILPKTVEEFEKDFPAIYLDIATDGIILFDKDHYVYRKLQKIREIIQEAGLERRVKFNSLIWKWKNRPHLGWRIDWSGVNGIDQRSKVQVKTQ